MGLLSRITAALTPGTGRKASAPAGSVEVSLGHGAASGPVPGMSAGSGTGPSWSIDLEAGS